MEEWNKYKVSIEYIDGGEDEFKCAKYMWEHGFFIAVDITGATKVIPSTAFMVLDIVEVPL